MSVCFCVRHGKKCDDFRHLKIIGFDCLQSQILFSPTPPLFSIIVAAWHYFIKVRNEIFETICTRFISAVNSSQIEQFYNFIGGISSSGNSEIHNKSNKICVELHSNFLLNFLYCLYYKIVQKA